MKNVKTLLIDKNKLFREGMKRLLGETRFEVVADLSDMNEVEAWARENEKPELVVLDFSSPTHWKDDLDKVHSLFPDSRYVILTESLSAETLAAGLAAGAGGYLLKDISYDSLVQALQIVMLGETVLPTNLAATLVRGMVHLPSAIARSDTSHGLSDRELQILRCLVHGDSNKVIANRLGITEATVKVHLKNVLRKVSAANRTQAAIWALNHGIAGPVEPLGAGRGTGSAASPNA